MIKAVRQKKIRELLEAGGSVAVADLAQRFDASPITIRRDLIALEKMGLLSRTHGGALSDAELEAAQFATVSYDDREKLNAGLKMLIAERAAALIKDGDSIILNAGTTMSHLARALKGHSNLRVVTNGLTVASEFAKSKSTHVHMIGGIVDFPKMATTGQAAEQTVREFRVPRAFLGISGISVIDGMSMYNAQEAQINRAFLESSREATLVVDSSKFASQAFYRIAPLSAAHRIITDSAISADDRKAIEKLGVELIIA